MNYIKVLGIGSPFGDDQVGWRVAESLKNQIALQVNISQYVFIETHDRPGIRLIELMKEASTIFIIDAVNSNSEIGTIHRFNNDDIFESENKFSTHDIGISQALQLGCALNLLPENIIFYGIEINTIEFGTNLSKPVEAAIEQVVAQLKHEIINMLSPFFPAF
ncbi:hydrogenase expression/formation protein [Legionella birminghamensis]|uniref:Hydrogenase expression/formation protein n=1 Tax=Legionella birminghamensis TaxID=28083 RepID=A0A378IB26_9GAMM|nr:hydrogenase maturation protease [Legionella birminghamensis]KTC74850.1 hydrogenase expression/formation protein [Legionella birminghamensis]STX31751.1 hydrogenase expression/formation protein [Legionella birminghamensis]